MAAGATYEPIATQTLASAAATITFSSIAATYTDLRVVLVGIDSASGGVRMTYNGDTSALYSNTQLYGAFSAAYSGRSSSIAYCDLSVLGLYSTPALITVDIFSYAGSTFKTNLVTFSGDYNAASTDGVARVVNLYRSTNAITSIELKLSAGSYDTGTTATLYGIKAA
tara:strand:- start:2091 stop:2594 length:504 start_codon:yes stop_codon:yes gene_type:complete